MFVLINEIQIKEGEEENNNSNNNNNKEEEEKKMINCSYQLMNSSIQSFFKRKKFYKLTKRSII